MTERPKTYAETIFFCKKALRKVLPRKLLNVYFSFFPLVGSLIYGYPSRKVKIIGVTGTDGKSSTVVFIARILRSAGYKVGFFSSALFSEGDGEQRNTFKMTMPGRFFMQGFLARLIKNKCDFAVIEVTSEGIKQKRHLFVNFDVAVCTNIKPEHIESHGGFANYKQAKAELFKNLGHGFKKSIEKTIVVNNDDTEAQSFLEYEADKKIAFGFSKQSFIHGEIEKATLFENVVKIIADGQEEIFELKVGGPFIAENVLAAVATAHALSVSMSVARQALENNPSVPGRFEIITEKPFTIVDYAHSVAAVEKILSFVRHHWEGKITHIFGAAGGGRDKWKRPKLAELSEKYTDFSILTEENSFDEKIENILSDISNGFRNKNRIKIIPRRPDAVSEAMQGSNDQTLLLFTGKGCETVIAGPLGRKISYSEKETIWQILNLQHD